MKRGPISQMTIEVALEHIGELERRRAELMPDIHVTLRVMLMVWQRLRDLGWNDPIYCPKDGTLFQSIEFGSTGIFDCRYVGEWPDGHWESLDGHDVYPSSRQPVMWKAKRRSGV
jgi:hypothetical protein